MFSREGFRVLVLDAENSTRQIRRRFRRYVGAINYLRETCALPPIDWKDQLRFIIQPAGLDLADHRDFARIEAKIAAAAPDLVVAGPLYRLSKLDIRDEQAAKALVDALDQLRVKYKFAPWSGRRADRGSCGLRVDDQAFDGVLVELLRTGEEISAELDEPLPELADTGRGSSPPSWCMRS